MTLKQALKSRKQRRRKQGLNKCILFTRFSLSLSLSLSLSFSFFSLILIEENFTMMTAIIAVTQSQSLELSMFGHSLKGFSHRASSVGSDRASLDRTQIHDQLEHSYRLPSALYSLYMISIYVLVSHLVSVFSKIIHCRYTLSWKLSLMSKCGFCPFLFCTYPAVIFLSSHYPLINGRNSPEDPLDQGFLAQSDIG